MGSCKGFGPVVQYLGGTGLRGDRLESKSRLVDKIAVWMMDAFSWKLGSQRRRSKEIEQARLQAEASSEVFVQMQQERPSPTVLLAVP